MKKTAYLGLSLLLIGALAMPSFAQTTTPDGLYTAFYNEKDAAKKTQLGEQFISNADAAFKSSQYLPYIFQTVFSSYVTGQNWAKVMDTADKIGTFVPNADAKLKTFVYTQAMAVANQNNNPAKTVDFGEKLLALDPTNLNALMFVPTAIIASLPAANPAKDAALNKAQDYAKKLATAAKPAGVGDADWATIQGQAHFNVGFALLSKTQYADAITEFEAALKLNKKDDQSHYQMGAAFANQLPQAQKDVLDAYNKENAAKTAKKDQIEIDELAATRSALEADFRTKRDQAIDAFAKAVALAGPTAAPAKQQLDRLWKQKNNESLDGLDAFVAQKKAEIG